MNEQTKYQYYNLGKEAVLLELKRKVQDLLTDINDQLTFYDKPDKFYLIEDANTCFEIVISAHDDQDALQQAIDKGVKTPRIICLLGDK